jgi:hypothetical protein
LSFTEAVEHRLRFFLITSLGKVLVLVRLLYHSIPLLRKWGEMERAMQGDVAGVAAKRNSEYGFPDPH